MATPIAISTSQGGTWVSVIQAQGRVLRNDQTKWPPAGYKYWSVRMMHQVCLWLDGRSTEPTMKNGEGFGSRYDVSPYESQGLRQQVYILASVFYQKAEILAEYREMPIWASSKAIKAKYAEADALYLEEYETYKMMLKLSTDLPIDGFLFINP